MAKHATRWLGVLAVSLCLFAAASPARAEENTEEYYKLMKEFVDTFEQIDRNYVKDVDRRQLVEAASSTACWPSSISTPTTSTSRDHPLYPGGRAGVRRHRHTGPAFTPTPRG
jgi:deoxyribodipyrimidine photolyase